MRVLVTGGTGCIGSHTAAALLDAGHTVRLLVRDPAKVERVPVLRGREGIEVAQGDVVDRASVLLALEGCQQAVHSAALLALDDRRAAEARRVNVEGTRNVVGGAIDRGLEQVVYVSSVSLFGFTGTPVSVESPIVESRGGYAASKVEAERYVRGLQSQGAPVAITYPSGVHGPETPELTPNQEGLQFWLAASPRTSGGAAVVDVRDLASAHVAILSRASAPSRWLLGGRFLTWEENWRTLERVTGRSIPYLPMPGLVLRTSGRIGDLVKRVVPFGFPMTLEAMQTATQAAPYDSRPAITELGVTFRSTDETFVDEIRWMFQAGQLSAKTAGVLAS